MTIDTRNNWVSLMFVCKYRFNCFLKQSHIDTCSGAFYEFRHLGFDFAIIGFAGSHVHFRANVPKKYSISEAIGMLKSRSAKRMFEKHPNFRKRYPRGAFWSEYEHHQSAGLTDAASADAYNANQQNHHNIKVVDDRQKKLKFFIADRDTVTSAGVTEEGGERGL